MGLPTFTILCVLLGLSESFFTKQCLPGWTLFKNSCYVAYQYQTTWQKAADECRSFWRGSLVIIESVEENTFVNNLLLSQGVRPGNVWFDGSDMDEEGKWVWVDKDRLLTYVNWGTYEPNEALDGENCLVIWFCDNCAKKWNDLGCDEKANFVCERPYV